MKSCLYIASKLKVGFQKREDTYTNKLGFINYMKEDSYCFKKSWDNWIDKNINPLEIENIPTEGFVINENVGGVSYGGYNPRMEKIRIYDPRGFEIEITTNNLLYILQETSSIKGKGLEGEFVYAWDKTRLYLLPISSKEYLENIKYTNLLKQNVEEKDLVVGARYKDKNMQDAIYLGLLPHYTTKNILKKDGSLYYYQSKSIKHLFYRLDSYIKITTIDVKNLVQQVNDKNHEYEKCIKKYYDDSSISSKWKSFSIQKTERINNRKVFILQDDIIYAGVRNFYGDNYNIRFRVELNEAKKHILYHEDTEYTIKQNEPTYIKIMVEYENGKEEEFQYF